MVVFIVRLYLCSILPFLLSVRTILLDRTANNRLRRLEVVLIVSTVFSIGFGVNQTVKLPSTGILVTSAAFFMAVRGPQLTNESSRLFRRLAVKPAHYLRTSCQAENNHEYYPILRENIQV